MESVTKAGRSPESVEPTFRNLSFSHHAPRHSFPGNQKIERKHRRSKVGRVGPLSHARNHPIVIGVDSASEFPNDLIG
jgi:hypothetical protein